MDSSAGHKDQPDRLKTIITIDSELNKIQDLDILLERILTFARRMVNADAGSIYLKKGDGLQITYSQNDTLAADLSSIQKLIYNIFTVPLNKKTVSGYAGATKTMVNIADVYAIPAESPFTYDTSYDRVARYQSKSNLTIPLLSNLGELFGVLQLINKRHPAAPHIHTAKVDPEGNGFFNDVTKVIGFSADDEAIARHFANNVVIALERAKMTRATLERMIQMAELRDPKETGPHVNRVAGYSIEIYEQWAKHHDLPQEKIQKDIDNFRMAAMLHDVGKVAISDLILKKSSGFTPEEREIMKTHTVSGAKLFLTEQSDFDKMALSVALNHHENWDGTGYPGFVDIRTGKPLRKDAQGKPLGKRGLEIPLYGRIVALADVYDALRNQRSYKQAWTEDDVLREIRSLSGSKFDPELVEIFFEVYPTLQTISARYADHHS